MNKEQLFIQKKQEFINVNHRKALFLCLAVFCFIMIWPFAILTGPLYGIIEITPNYGGDDLCFTFATIFFLLALVFLIIGIINVIICKNRFHKSINYFDNDEKLAFLNKYLKNQLISFIFYALSFLLIFIGLKIKSSWGMVITSCGFPLFAYALSSNIYHSISRKTYKEKSKVLGDIIKQKGLYASLKIYERTIILISLIAFIIVATVFIINSNSIGWLIVATCFDFILFGYLCFKTIKLSKKGNNEK